MIIKSFVILLIIAVLASGCTQLQQFLASEPPPSTPVKNTTEPEVVNTTLATNATIEVVSPRFDYRALRNGNATVYLLKLSGDSIIIIGSNNETVLLDTGIDSDYRAMILALRNWGVEKIDAVVISRNVRSSYANIAALSTVFPIGKVYHNGLAEFIEPLSSLKDVVPLEAVNVDRTVQVGTLQLRLIVPYDDSSGFSSEENENSILTKVTYGKSSVIYAAGCDFACEGRVVDADLNADILISAIRGSCDSTTTFFLNKVQPQAVATQGNPCGEFNARMETFGIKNYYTEKDGVLAFTTDGQGSWVVGGEQ